MMNDTIPEPDIELLTQAYDRLQKQDPTAISDLESLSERGSILSNCYLGDLYDRGEIVKKDIDKARYWYKKYASPQHPLGFLMLGRLEYESNDKAAALQWFKKGSECGYLPCMFREGDLYCEDKHDEEQLAQGKLLLEMAAQKGHLFAKRDLATLYVKGVFGKRYVFYGVYLLICLLGNMAALFFSKDVKNIEFDERVLG